VYFRARLFFFVALLAQRRRQWPFGDVEAAAAAVAVEARAVGAAAAPGGEAAAQPEAALGVHAYDGYLMRYEGHVAFGVRRAKRRRAVVVSVQGGAQSLAAV
jgi:hypothetical protein